MRPAAQRIPAHQAMSGDCCLDQAYVIYDYEPLSSSETWLEAADCVILRASEPT